MTGSGTSANPYIITTLTDLNNVRNNISAYYELGCDIDASDTANWNSGAGWIPLGKYENFTGTIDGKGFCISNLYINNTSSQLVGFIYLLGLKGASHAIVKNLGLVNISYTITASYSGGIAGVVDSNASILNCFVTGTINCQSSGGHIGGITGECNFNSDSSNPIYITNCWTNVSIVNAGTAIGGIVGDCLSGTKSIDNCYAIGLITGNSSLGGVCGTGGTNYIHNCYWDTQTTGLSTSSGGSGLTTTQMKTQSSFVNWDFTNIWAITTNNYPTLRAFIKSTQHIKSIIFNIKVNSSIKKNIKKHISNLVKLLTTRKRKIRRNILITIKSNVVLRRAIQKFLIKGIAVVCNIKKASKKNIYNITKSSSNIKKKMKVNIKTNIDSFAYDNRKIGKYFFSKIKANGNIITKIINNVQIYYKIIISNTHVNSHIKKSVYKIFITKINSLCRGFRYISKNVTIMITALGKINYRRFLVKLIITGIKDSSSISKNIKKAVISSTLIWSKNIKYISKYVKTKIKIIVSIREIVSSFNNMLYKCKVCIIDRLMKIDILDREINFEINERNLDVNVLDRNIDSKIKERNIKTEVR